MLIGIVGIKEVKQPLAIVLEDEPIPIRERRPDLPKALAATIDRCLIKNPRERFRNAKELKKALSVF